MNVDDVQKEHRDVRQVRDHRVIHRVWPIAHVGGVLVIQHTWLDTMHSLWETYLWSEDGTIGLAGFSKLERAIDYASAINRVVIGRRPPGDPYRGLLAAGELCADPALQTRADADNQPRTAFRTCAQQARATTEALNTPQGQAALAQLDANPNGPRVTFHAPVSSRARVARPGGAATGADVADSPSNRATVRIFPQPDGSHHIQTSFPRT